MISFIEWLYWNGPLLQVIAFWILTVMGLCCLGDDWEGTWY